MYLREQTIDSQLELLLDNDAAVPPDVRRQVSSSSLPATGRVSNENGFVGELIMIKGSEFVNSLTEVFRDMVAEPVGSTTRSIRARITNKNGNTVVVDIIVLTDAGELNGATFIYRAIKEPCEAIYLIDGGINNSDGGTFV